MTSLRPITCYPWCTDQDGHPGQTHTDDQWCRPAETVIPLAFYPSEEELDGTFEAERATVYGRAFHDGRRSQIVIDRGDHEVLRLTAAEAQQLAGALVSTLTVLDDGGAS